MSEQADNKHDPSAPIVVFRAVRIPPNLRHILIVAVPGWLLMLTFVDGVIPKVIFTIVFVLFIAAGVFMLRHSAQNWPESISLDDIGVGSDKLEQRHGIARLPWAEIEDIDLFHSSSEGIGRVGAFIRFKLREGPFRAKVFQKQRSIPGLGWDVNIPLSTTTPPDEVVEIVRGHWLSRRNR